MKHQRLLLIRNRCFSTCLFLTVVLVFLIACYYYFLPCSNDYEDASNYDEISVERNTESADDGEVGGTEGTTVGDLNNFDRNLWAMRYMGGSWTTLDMLKELTLDDKSPVLGRMIGVRRRIDNKRESHVTYHEVMNINDEINLAAVVCGERQEEFLTMAKSAVMFSQDAPLHFIIFSDNDTILDVAQDILELKWTVNELGWDFTYELQLVWFPDDGVNWGRMYAPCATQRLFFPQLLPHIDSLIFLDSDILVLSNLTDLWSIFSREMKGGKLAGLALNNEPNANGFYSKNVTGIRSLVPYHGASGLNAGVMLMNLTEMRVFNFTQRAIAAQILYDGKIILADQDIINIIFHTFPQKLHVLDCSYNFYWVHCGWGEDMCQPRKDRNCFCNTTFSNGVHILHGNMGSFVKEEFFTGQTFLTDAYRAFRKFDLLTDSPAKLVRKLKNMFMAEGRQCDVLTPAMLYCNAELYFRTVYQQPSDWL